MNSNGTFDRTYEDERVLPRGNLFQVIRRRLWLIALIVVVLVGAVGAFSFLQTPTYRSSIKILISQDEQAGYQPNLQTEAQGLQLLTKTMAEAVNTRPVVEDVIRRQGLSMSPGALKGNLEAKQVADTQFIGVSYQDTDPERAQSVVDTVGDVFSEQVSEGSPSANGYITATVWERASWASPISPDPVRNILLALALGLMLGVGLAFLLDNMGNDWRSPEEAEQVSGVPNLAVIPEFKAPKS